MTTLGNTHFPAGESIDLSIVVPVEGRFDAICELVASITVSWLTYAAAAGEHRPPTQVLELVLVDSTQPPLDTRRIPEWDASYMRCLLGGVNVRKKRNLGVSKARGRWIGFVDSDCVVAPGYVGAALQVSQSSDPRAYAGRIEFQGEENWIWRMISATQLTSPETQSQGEGEVAWCATANLLVAKSLFDSLQGFDETLPFRLGGDDVDFGLRLQRSGCPLHILSSAVVVHPKSPWCRLDAILPRAWRWGRIEYHLALRHAERVRAMPPYFTGTFFGFTVAAAVGAAVSGRLGLLWLIPLWILVSTLLTTAMRSGARPKYFVSSYLGRWLHIYYHVATVREYLSKGSLRFLWQALVLEKRMDLLFPAEPLESWAYLIATAAVAALGVAVVCS